MDTTLKAQITTLVLPAPLLRRIYHGEVKYVILPLPGTKGSDQLDHHERITDRTVRFYFNGHQMMMHHLIGLHMGFKEAYAVFRGRTMYFMDQEAGVNWNFKWESPLTMPLDRLRRLFKVQAIHVVKRQALRRLAPACGARDFSELMGYYPQLKKVSQVALIHIEHEKMFHPQ